MAANLGLNVTLCGVFGGETGTIIRATLEHENIRVRGIEISGENGSYVHDRRSGGREVIAEVDPWPLSRHEIDDLYSISLTEGLAADVAILGGPHSEQILPPGTYYRLVSDLAGMEIPVVADLSGPTLMAAAKGGVYLLKVSHEDLIEDGLAKSDTTRNLISAMHDLSDAGAQNVVISRSDQPALALVEGELWEITGPSLAIVDHRGAGDSMTAGMAAAIAEREPLTGALKRGTAAGAANISRRGLATGEPELVHTLADRVELRKLDKTGKRIS